MQQKTKWMGMTVVVMMLMLLLSACGGGNNIGDGANNMKDVLADVKASVDAGDPAKAKEETSKLEEAWESFEDDVKEQSKELYDKAETPLHAIEAGVGIEPLDQEALNKSIKELDQVLGEIAK
ncbi:hypothetical protein [Paenibacillus abyssi]|uniref:Uncharacterized protein n=1 Tax=Paenibacillus abyssi TaxID=1340531 RepID=A0A917LD23_9BACL|nr:hypothetical protein [Paenibacillus abyssi]GGG14301.1 hypothetical protein GCM10010916_34000 [Paenibacillus abyssi]